MNALLRAERRRWLVVGGGVLVLCALPVAIAARPVSDPGVDAAALYRRVLASAERPYQGYVESRGRIGLPDLAELRPVTGLLGGTTRIRAWYAGPETWRVAELTPTGERDVYRSAGGTFVWDYERNLLTQILGPISVRLPWAADVLPPELARRLLTTAAPGDPVTSIPARRVAGVTAAGLRLRPADPDTTIAHVDVWAEPDTGLPLQVEIAATEPGRPVFTTRFLDLRQQPPPAGSVAPPTSREAGYATTTAHDLAAITQEFADAIPPPELAGRPRTVVLPDVPGAAGYGHGFGSFVVLSLPGRLGFQWARAARDAGGVDVAAAAGVAGEIIEVRAPLVTAIIVRSAAPRPNRRSFLLAGLVTPQPLRQAAIELLRGLP